LHVFEEASVVACDHRSAKGDDISDSCLVELHHRPGALDEDERRLGPRWEAVPAVEPSPFRIPRGPGPFAVGTNIVWIEASSHVSDGTALEIVKPDASTSKEKSAPPPNSGLESPEGLGKQSAAFEEGVGWIEGEFVRERAEDPFLRGMNERR